MRHPITPRNVSAMSRILWENLPPRGWKIELGVWDKGDRLEVEVSEPLPPGSWVDWDDADLVLTWWNELGEVPGFPEDWGETREKALKNYLEAEAERLLYEIYDQL